MDARTKDALIRRQLEAKPEMATRASMDEATTIAGGAATSESPIAARNEVMRRDGMKPLVQLNLK